MSRAGARLQLSEEERDRIADTLRLAEALGGEAITLPASDRRIADDVIGYAQANNVTQIVIGKSARTRWFEILHGSVVHDLVRRSGNISVHVIAGDTIAGEPIPKKSVRAAERDDAFDPRPYVVRAAGGGGRARLLRELIQPWVGVDNVDLVFLTAIVGVAVRFGLWPSLLASVASSLSYNFFFLPPIYTFTITDPTNVAAFVLLHARGRHRLHVSPRAAARRRWRRPTAPAPPSRSIRSAASSPAPARSTTCCGRPPIRPR